MKESIFVGFLSAAAGLALAYPGAEIYTRNNLTWTGQVEVDGPEVKLTGDAQSIYRRILEINPNYDVELGINRKNARRIPNLGNIAKRASTSSNFTCTYGTYVDVAPITEGIKTLYAIGTGTCSAPAGQRGDGGCTRLTCSDPDSAGIWLCNDNSAELSIQCDIAADNAVEILIQCQETVYAGSQTWDSTVRGQIFSDNTLWNVIINTDTSGC
ncbi:hypothetical protein BX600DRAFT_530528 [Xylariales sp. PMI_506]|nr:hypothetical protein BX600DRAFT_530528 [Xylariales sp. PMI_506]